MNLKKLYEKIFYRSIRSDLKYEEATQIIASQKSVVIDVRTPEEYNKKHYEGAINIPLYEIERVENEIKNKDELIFLYCKVGKRSEMAKQILMQNGYKNIYTFDAKVWRY